MRDARLRPEVAAALARLDARESDRRIVTPPPARIEWRRWYSRHRGGCSRCGAKSGLKVYEVRPERRERSVTRSGYVMREAARFNWIDCVCFDGAACEARRHKQSSARERRSGTLQWCQSRFESPDVEVPKGSCTWCGEPIVYTDDAPYRVKTRWRHRGDEHEVDDRDCRREHARSYAFNGRELVLLRGDPCCVWCGVADRWHDPEDGTEGWWIEVSWEADHIVPLEDGGAHDATNIARCCTECHKRKTASENAARRAKRAVDKAQPAR